MDVFVFKFILYINLFNQYRKNTHDPGSMQEQLGRRWSIEKLQLRPQLKAIGKIAHKT